MKNIESILKDIGLTIPEDKKEAFTKAFEANYKTVKELDGVKDKLTKVNEKYETDIKKRDDDLAELKVKLESTKKELSEAKVDAEKVTKLQSTIDELEALKTTYADDKKKYEKQLEDQQYEFALKEKISGLKFTSNAAKKSFMNDLMNDRLKVDKNGELLGFDDYVKSCAEEDAGIFEKEENTKKAPKPKFGTKTNQNDAGDDGAEEEPKERPVIW